MRSVLSGIWTDSRVVFLDAFMLYRLYRVLNQIWGTHYSTVNKVGRTHCGCTHCSTINKVLQRRSTLVVTKRKTTLWFNILFSDTHPFIVMALRIVMSRYTFVFMIKLGKCNSLVLFFVKWYNFVNILIF